MLKVIVSGSIHKPGAWGVNFGPLSNVDEEIAGSGGQTLRTLYEAGAIRCDCFEEVKPEDPGLPVEEPAEEKEED
jgi:hypothetical protein